MIVDKRARIASAGWATLAGYAVLLLLLLPLQSLWLDELMEVAATARLPLHDVIAGYAAHSAGQSPLGALEQACAIKLLGYSAFAARLPAALSSILACAGMLVLSRRAGLRHAWLTLLIFAFFPIVLRYGTEARPYSQALCVAVWLSVLFLDLLKRPGLGRFALYGVLLTIGLYTQPYVLFVALAQALFLVFDKRWSALGSLLVAIAAAALTYLPWYLHSRAFWRQEIDADQLHFHLAGKLALLIPRELTGAGYLGTLAAILLAIYGLPLLFRKGSHPLLWAALLIVPVCLTLLADLAFDYFFAIRQVIFVLPALAIACSSGLERLCGQKGSRLALGMGALLLALNGGYCLRWFTKPRENWAAAAYILEQSVDSGACYIALPSGSSAYYEFFQPVLRKHQCAGTDLETRLAVALAISPYLPDAGSKTRLEARLRAASFAFSGKSNPGQPEIRLYRRAK